MNEDKKYNGWANYETWNAALWIDNDGYGEELRERAEEILSDNDGDKEEAHDELHGMIESYIEEFAPEVKGMYADLLNSALREIDYHEIADHYVKDAISDMEYQKQKEAKSGVK